MKAIFVLGLCLSAVLALPASRRRLKSLVDDHADDPRYYYRNDDSSDKSKSSYYYRNDDSSEKGKSSYYYRNGDSSENGKARYYYRNDDSSDNSEARYYYRNDDSSDKAKSSYYYRNDDSSDNSKMMMIEICTLSHKLFFFADIGLGRVGEGIRSPGYSAATIWDDCTIQAEKNPPS
ncbi:unnamed protein product [Leptidea sinapis]|uniref:Uncharacterized protein n=1 Tax=Leptidea sinapis TaxID=189913 RepID=A0A5E4QG41_9NEOP|nr:unnamed protein product [Leptidea sinapis]